MTINRTWTKTEIALVALLVAALLDFVNGLSTGALHLPLLPTPYAAAIIGLIVFLVAILVPSFKQAQEGLAQGDDQAHVWRAAAVSFLTAVVVAAQSNSLPLVGLVDPNLAGLIVMLVGLAATAILHRIGAADAAVVASTTVVEQHTVSVSEAPTP